jgi:purine-binding chemotaxis protein CheW
MSNLIQTHLTTAKPVVRAEESQYLTFWLADEMFAIGILNIKEIIEYGQLTSVPMMPSFVRGVINLRGQVVPVIDLQARFGRSSVPVSKRSCIVIIEVMSDAESEAQVIGVVVDSVSEVLSIAASQIEKAPQFGARLRPDFIGGMGKIADRFVIILNVDKVLSVEELSMLTGQADVATGSPE